MLKTKITKVKATLQRITEDQTFDIETAGEALALMKALDYNFCLCLTVFSDLLSLCNVVSKQLQLEPTNIAAPSAQVEDLIAELE